MRFHPARTLVLVVLATSACSSTTTELAYTSDEPAPQLAQLADAGEQPAPRVAAVAGPVEGPAVLNSDNKPAMLRTGLNSDPNNPSGAPARSAGGLYD